jgi:hypothetical protein
MKVHKSSLLFSLAAGFVALGCLVRTWHYILNYSLNHDDAALALNIMQRSIWQLRDQLDYVQFAPWGFLALERITTQLAGTSESALRLVPFIASVVSVPAFLYLANTRLERAEAVVATGFLAMSQGLVGATAQVKQYSVEVLSSILLLTACGPLLNDSATRRQRLFAAVCGALSIWFAFTATFALAGIGLASIVGRQSAQELRERLGVMTVWIMSGLLYFASVLRFQMRDSPIFSLWQHEFLPRDPAAWPGWLVQALENIGSVGTAIRLAPVAGLALVLASWLAFRSRGRFSLALVFTILTTLIAACLRRYPFGGRFLLFAAPLFLLLACGEIGRWSRTRTPVIRLTLIVTVSVALMYTGASLVKRTFLIDPGFDDPRAALAHVRQHLNEGDLIYASSAARPSLLYYQPALQELHRDPSRWQNETARIWFVFFWPTEAGFDQRAVREAGRSGVVLQSVTRKLHTTVLWRLDASGKGR